MSKNTFHPRNELERKLVDAQEGKVTCEYFMQELSESLVFMPVQESNTMNPYTNGLLKPLTIQSNTGFKVIVLFTSPARAVSFLKDYPEFNRGLLQQFKTIFNTTQAKYGFLLNPGWPVGFELHPEHIDQAHETIH